MHAHTHESIEVHRWAPPGPDYVLHLLVARPDGPFLSFDGQTRRSPETGGRRFDRVWTDVRDMPGTGREPRPALGVLWYVGASPAESVPAL